MLSITVIKVILKSIDVMEYFEEFGRKPLLVHVRSIVVRDYTYVYSIFSIVFVMS